MGTTSRPAPMALMAQPSVRAKVMGGQGSEPGLGGGEEAAAGHGRRWEVAEAGVRPRVADAIRGTSFVRCRDGEQGRERKSGRGRKAD